VQIFVSSDVVHRAIVIRMCAICLI